MIQPPFKPSRIAIAGTIGVSVAIAISSFSVVRAQRFLPLSSVFYKCSSGQACVTGDSTGVPWGVRGLSVNGNGVVGESAGLGKSGVWGVSLASGSGGFGVFAESADPSGKYPALVAQGDKSSTSLFYADNRANGASCSIDPNSNLTCTGTVTGRPLFTSSAGVIGESSSSYGVSGSSVNNYGVYGSSTNSNGVQGVSSSGGGSGVMGIGSYFGVYAAGGGVALKADILNNQGLAFDTKGIGSNGGSCAIDFYGNLSCSGTIMGGHGMEMRHTINGQHVVGYTSESTSATIEDVGETRIVGGAAGVSLGSRFAAMMDRSKPYYVFLTPLGETRGLYVSAKTESGFQVREAANGHSDFAFDYRVVGYPLDSAQNQPPPPSAPRQPILSVPKLPHAPIH